MGRASAHERGGGFPIKTVEAHMTAILTRSQISSRGELLGRLLARLTGPG